MADTNKNPSGIEQKIQLHYEHEKKGKFVVVPDVKPPTMIFVRSGRSEQKAIESYIKRIIRSKCLSDENKIVLPIPGSRMVAAGINRSAESHFRQRSYQYPTQSG